MNKFINLILSGVVLFSLTGCGENTTNLNNAKNINSTQESINTTSHEELVQIPSPFCEYPTLKEAEAAVGFKVKVPTHLPEGYTEESIYVMDNEMVDITYSNGSSQLCFRQQKGTEDISGDYNEYSDINTLVIDKLNVTIKGNEDKVYNAIWTDGDYTFAFTLNTLSEGLENNTMITLISSVQ